MIFNIAYAKKTFRLFCPKKHYMIHFFLIAMDDWWFVIVCCLIKDDMAKHCCAKHSRYCKDYHRSLDKFKRQRGRGRFLGVPFWISLGVLGVICTSRGMIRG